MPFFSLVRKTWASFSCLLPYMILKNMWSSKANLVKKGTSSEIQCCFLKTSFLLFKCTFCLSHTWNIPSTDRLVRPLLFAISHPTHILCLVFEWIQLSARGRNGQWIWKCGALQLGEEVLRDLRISLPVTVSLMLTFPSILVLCCAVHLPRCQASYSLSALARWLVWRAPSMNYVESEAS